jgi:hypothetical protein
VQRGEMDSHLAGLAGARGSYFLLGLSLLSVTVVLVLVRRSNGSLLAGNWCLSLFH